MLLPSRLEDTTLGDLLGLLHRESLTGTVELVQSPGGVHRILLTGGQIAGIESELGPKLGELLRARPNLSQVSRTIDRFVLSALPVPLGQHLIEQRLISAEELAFALRAQCLARLEQLFELKQARILFRAPRLVGRGPGLLDAREFLHGRPRRRAREHAQTEPTQEHDAWQILGLSPGAEPAAIRAAFRRRAALLHPDHAARDERERARRHERFVRLSVAYRSLVA